MKSSSIGLRPRKRSKSFWRFCSAVFPVYIVERVNITTGKPFADGEHILYVNGEYRDDSDIGKLMHDFNCTDAADMNFKLLADRTRYLKENPKGVNEMCKVIEDMRREERIEVALRMLEAGKYALDEIANISDLPLQDGGCENLISVPHDLIEL